MTAGWQYQRHKTISQIDRALRKIERDKLAKAKLAAKEAKLASQQAKQIGFDL
jgi:hypothetical protein